MFKKVQLKKSTSIFLLFLSCFLLASCGKSENVDNVRDSISIKKIDLKYVKTKNPSFFIQSFFWFVDDNRIGKDVDLGLYPDDLEWAIDLLNSNKKEIYEKKKPNSNRVNLSFEEFPKSVEHTRSKYNGKQTTFYISKSLREKFINKYLGSHPVNTVLKKSTYKSDEIIEGYVTLTESAPVELGINLIIDGERKDMSSTPIETIKILDKTNPFNKEKIIPFKINTAELLKQLNTDSDISISTTSIDGVNNYDFDKFQLVSK
ncbi:hypothetical protein [Gottfriedia acidiceleris]|uniref:hypothetical protein n=1 Tax=Gottfriedia acidiceleris TaxID=371036 RepID=UPI000B44FF7A|nr:hypothetical protein [Gottfriedia acidiceleris]